jgi:uncharacterized membrane protein
VAVLVEVAAALGAVALPETGNRMTRYYTRNLLARLFSHLYGEVRGISGTFEQGALARIESAIANSELSHSAELRVAIEAAMPLRAVISRVNPRARALAVFSALKVWDTQDNNGVLIYIDIADHAVEIVADRGIFYEIEPAYWDRLCYQMTSGFKVGNFEATLIQAVKELSIRLHELYPVKPGDKNPNQLPNQPIVL